MCLCVLHVELSRHISNSNTHLNWNITNMRICGGREGEWEWERGDWALFLGRFSPLSSCTLTSSRTHSRLGTIGAVVSVCSFNISMYIVRFTWYLSTLKRCGGGNATRDVTALIFYSWILIQFRSFVDVSIRRERVRATIMRCIDSMFWSVQKEEKTNAKSSDWKKN